MAALAAAFKEHATVLGKRSRLVSIITRPASTPTEDLPAIVILNTGIVHRVGHHRMYVTLSRRLAAAGHTVVRFDFSGIGDSLARNDGVAPIAACLSEVREVLDSVSQTYRISRFVLIGLCSGADHAVLYSSTDPRIEALVMMDPTLPPTPRYYVHYVVQRLANARSWWSVISGRSGLFHLATTHLLHRMRPKSGGIEQLTLQDLPFSSHLASCYRAVSERGVRMLSVFTSVSGRHTYHKQILDAFPETSVGALRLEYFPDSDHVFSAPAARERLYGLIQGWLRP